MKYKDFGIQIMTLQRNLQKLGYGNFVPTGYFGDKTLQAVLNYQKDLGLSQTGIWGNEEQSRLNSELIYKTAISFLGKDASPEDLAPDELGCADSVCGVLFSALNNPEISWEISTLKLFNSLKSSKGYIQVQEPRRGDIIISPTGMGNVKIPHGHIGIIGYGTIMSNNSDNGKFDTHLSPKDWNARYVILGQYPVYYFRKV